MALAHIIHYVHGVTLRKTPAILEALTGIGITQGAITQDAMKRTEGTVGERYAELRASVREQSVVHTDDTGWRVGGRSAQLMAFVNPQLSVYQIRHQHRNEEVRELLPADFAGVMALTSGEAECRPYPGIRRHVTLRLWSTGPELRCGGTGGGEAAEMPSASDPQRRRSGG
jgi:hypothetical protein